MRIAGSIVIAVVVAALAGCGAGANTAAPVVTVTAPAPVEKSPEPIEQDDKEPTPTLIEETEETEEKEEKEEKEEAVEKKVLPDVVGMNLQEGQDTMQAAGFYILNDKDATGQNRFQVYDRNWVVTKQTPAAGRKVAVDTLIILYAKKIGE
ncbi:PASTA domain-containing protein [Streptosporangium sp. NPDC050280]|uniref:PASTA domain-containing protein n=1 Tax=unclassified Streptosporangium TaxID=2632669 RepID=UPI003448D283